MPWPDRRRRRMRSEVARLLNCRSLSSCRPGAAGSGTTHRAPLLGLAPRARHAPPAAKGDRSRGSCGRRPPAPPACSSRSALARSPSPGADQSLLFVEAVQTRENPERFYALSREQSGAERPSSHRPARQVFHGLGAKRERGPRAASARSGPCRAPGGSCGARRAPSPTPPPKHPPPRPRDPGGGWYAGRPPWVRTALGSTPARVGGGGGCDPPECPCPVGLCACPR